MLDAGPRRSEYPVNPYCSIALDYASVRALGAKKRNQVERVAWPKGNR
jgi:hypothetical protein